MCRHRGRSSVVACLLVALTLFIAGCGQSGSTADRAGKQPTTEPETPQPAAAQDASEGEAEDMPNESGVKLAAAQSRIRPPGEVPADSGQAEATDPRLLPPGKIPAADVSLPLDDVDAADLTMPEVKMTEHHAATCRVGVGEKFPDLQLPDMTGQPQTLSQLMGDKLTLVVFWNGQQPTATEELADLARYHLPRFGDRGLAIVAVNTGDDAQLAAELAKQAGAEFTILSDADGAAFQQVASEKLPRTYLLDAAGTVLWFDMEYSATTRRDMVAAIRYSLAHE